eukprot:scaffold3502_cov111-Cylindrotheca_fusiformis.AAC.3
MATELTKAYFQHKVNEAFDVESQEQVPDDEMVDGEEPPPKNSRGLMLHAVIVTALAMIIMYSLAMALFGGVVFYAGVVAIGTGASVVVAEYRLSKMDSKYTAILHRLGTVGSSQSSSSSPPVSL